jgi:hypothetical protein
MLLDDWRWRECRSSPLVDDVSTSRADDSFRPPLGPDELEIGFRDEGTTGTLSGSGDPSGVLDESMLAADGGNDLSVDGGNSFLYDMSGGLFNPDESCGDVVVESGDLTPGSWRAGRGDRKSPPSRGESGVLVSRPRPMFSSRPRRAGDGASCISLQLELGIWSDGSELLMALLLFISLSLDGSSDRSTFLLVAAASSRDGIEALGSRLALCRPGAGCALDAREFVSQAMPAAFNGAGRDPSLVALDLKAFLSLDLRVVNIVFLCR